MYVTIFRCQWTAVEQKPTLHDDRNPNTMGISTPLPGKTLRSVLWVTKLFGTFSRSVFDPTCQFGPRSEQSHKQKEMIAINNTRRLPPRLNLLKNIINSVTMTTETCSYLMQSHCAHRNVTLTETTTTTTTKQTWSIVVCCVSTSTWYAIFASHSNSDSQSHSLFYKNIMGLNSWF